MSEVSEHGRKIILILMCASMLAGNASASLEITDFFSDYTSSEVTVRSTGNHHGTIVFRLLDGINTAESQTIPFEAAAGEEFSRIIIWKNRPQKDYYTADVSIYNEAEIYDNMTYPVSYGAAAMPDFHIVDFSPSNKGVKLIIKSFNPGAVDIKVELLDNNSIVYSKIKEDVSLNTNTELKIDWPFLLHKGQKYNVRTKILTHRLYADPLINTYIANFTASDDVEILQNDVEVDEYGASVTLRGESQVPFDGFIDILATNRATNKKSTYRQQVEEILTAGKEDTAGVVWKNLEAGTYDINILAVNKDNISLDKFETVLRIPELEASPETTDAQVAPGFSYYLVFAAVVIVISILAAIGRKKGN